MLVNVMWQQEIHSVVNTDLLGSMVLWAINALYTYYLMIIWESFEQVDSRRSVSLDSEGLSFWTFYPMVSRSIGRRMSNRPLALPMFGWARTTSPPCGWRSSLSKFLTSLGIRLIEFISLFLMLPKFGTLFLLSNRWLRFFIAKDWFVALAWSWPENNFSQFYISWKIRCNDP